MIPISKPSIDDADKEAVLDVLASGQLAQGTWTLRLEDAFRELVGVDHAVATSSGTAALHLALLAHGVGPGDEVITTPFSFIATVNCILFVGARPVFADIEWDTFNLDPRKVEEAITSNTKAILPVHLYGHPCDMQCLTDIASRHRLVLIEDAAQAVGARFGAKHVGSFGTGAFSLYATKNVTTAEGGMITTDDDRVAHRARQLRNHGMSRTYHYDMLGYNFRMSDVHAAIGLSQLARLDSLIERRRANASFLSRTLRTITPPVVRPGCDHAWHQYTVRVNGQLNRDQAVADLHAAGIDVRVFYPSALHHYPHIKPMAPEAKLPIADEAAQQVMSLPVHPLLSPEDLETISTSVNAL